MSKERGEKVERSIPEEYRWDKLASKDGVELKNFYRQLLLDLGTKGEGRIKEIYANANSNIDEPKNLEKIIRSIDQLDWYNAKEEGLGNLYEGLLEKNANETKSGAGQYFTPRPLIRAMVEVLKPQPGEVVQDPSAGTGGFLIAADRCWHSQPFSSSCSSSCRACAWPRGLPHSRSGTGTWPSTPSRAR